MGTSESIGRSLSCQFVSRMTDTVLSLIGARHSLHELLIENRRWDPVTGTASAAIATYYEMLSSVANIFIKPVQVYRASPKPSPKGNTAGPGSIRGLSVSSLTMNGFIASQPTTVAESSALSSSAHLSPDSVVPSQEHAGPSVSSGATVFLIEVEFSSFHGSSLCIKLRPFFPSLFERCDDRPSPGVCGGITYVATTAGRRSAGLRHRHGLEVGFPGIREKSWTWTWGGFCRFGS